LISNLTELFKPTFYKLDQIESELDLDSEMPVINTDQNKLKQIITNLVKNAAEALPPKGKVTIRTRALVILDGHQYIEISISDNGPGIEPSLLDKLFTPIDTTKGTGHSGLGLTIVKKLVADLNGSIRYSQSNQSGAEFIILLPR
jgi:signal transduction histidine kinase